MTPRGPRATVAGEDHNNEGMSDWDTYLDDAGNKIGSEIIKALRRPIDDFSSASSSLVKPTGRKPTSGRAAGKRTFPTVSVTSSAVVVTRQKRVPRGAAAAAAAAAAGGGGTVGDESSLVNKKVTDSTIENHFISELSSHGTAIASEQDLFKMMYYTSQRMVFEAHEKVMY